MLLLEPGHTAFDLHFRILGTPVRVHPVFWLFSAIMGFGFLRAGIPPFLVWMACVFVSLLIHELGHVFMFRQFGAHAHVVLYAFGGLAVPDRRLYNRWQRMAVSIAGPFAEFLIIAVIAVVLAFRNVNDVMAIADLVLGIFGIQSRFGGGLELPPLVAQAVYILVYINVFWALLNLLPIYPLDGGQISRDFLDGLMPRGQGIRFSLGISLVLAGLLTVHCVAAANGKPLIPFLPSIGGMYMAILFGMLALQSFQMLQQE